MRVLALQGRPARLSYPVPRLRERFRQRVGHASELTRERCCSESQRYRVSWVGRVTPQQISVEDLPRVAWPARCRVGDG